jgi:hypothetical protein
VACIENAVVFYRVYFGTSDQGMNLGTNLSAHEDVQTVRCVAGVPSYHYFYNRKGEMDTSRVFKPVVIQPKYHRFLERE